MSHYFLQVKRVWSSTRCCHLFTIDMDFWCLCQILMSVRRLQTSVMEASVPIFLGSTAVCVTMDSWLQWTWGRVSVRERTIFRICSYIFPPPFLFFLVNNILFPTFSLADLICGTFSVSLIFCLISPDSHAHILSFCPCLPRCERMWLEPKHLSPRRLREH